MQHANKVNYILRLVRRESFILSDFVTKLKLRTNMNIKLGQEQFRTFCWHNSNANFRSLSWHLTFSPTFSVVTQLWAGQKKSPGQSCHTYHMFPWLFVSLQERFTFFRIIIMIIIIMWVNAQIITEDARRQHHKRCSKHVYSVFKK